MSIVPSFLRRHSGKLAGAVLALAISTVGGYEGLRLTAYKDPIGIPTVCYGETRGVEMGDVYTKGECDKLLGMRLVEFAKGIDKCLGEEIVATIPDKSYVTFVSLAYNIGEGAFCKSSIAKRIRAGDLKRACDALTLYNRAGGRVLRGLTNRRASERALCIRGLIE